VHRCGGSDRIGRADYLELAQWLQQSTLVDTIRIHLIHGESEALEGSRVHLQEHTAFWVNVAGYRDIFRL
jgi:metallo-beta-lactamase family protein